MHPVLKYGNPGNLGDHTKNLKTCKLAPAKKRRSKLKIVSINANSLVSDNKQALLSGLLKEHDPDGLCVCESKLDHTISDSVVLPQDSGYDIVSRKDNKLGSGGVLIAVKTPLWLYLQMIWKQIVNWFGSTLNSTTANHCLLGPSIEHHPKMTRK